MANTPAEIQSHLKDLQRKIEELELQKTEAEEIDFKRSRKCCPDVCSVIDKSISHLKDELKNAEKERIKIHKMITVASKIFKTEESDQKSLERQALKKTERIEELINEQITSLKTLKRTLSAEKVCECS